MFETADAAATFCLVLGSNFVLLLESLRRARVAEAPKARLDFFCGADLFWGAHFFSGAEEVVSMATPETMTKWRFLTHPGRKDTGSKNKCNSGLKSSSFDARHPGPEFPPFFFRAELLGISRIDRTVFYAHTRSD